MMFEFSIKIITIFNLINLSNYLSIVFFNLKSFNFLLTDQLNQIAFCGLFFEVTEVLSDKNFIQMIDV